ncbi:unnamed protein product [Lupinus luteus]|uniref:Uncharacterized protein n=1 Tax=Lupinus luteus TaxID=3873 RepID=A0AAV1WFT1_LUPLU
MNTKRRFPPSKRVFAPGPSRTYRQLSGGACALGGKPSTRPDQQAPGQLKVSTVKVAQADLIIQPDIRQVHHIQVSSLNHVSKSIMHESN